MGGIIIEIIKMDLKSRDPFVVFSTSKARESPTMNSIATALIEIIKVLKRAFQKYLSSIRSLKFSIPLNSGTRI
jgi:hypothetical protein